MRKTFYISDTILAMKTSKVKETNTTGSFDWSKFDLEKFSDKAEEVSLIIKRRESETE